MHEVILCIVNWLPPQVVDPASGQLLLRMEGQELCIIPMQLLMGPLAVKRVSKGEKYYTHVLRLRYG